MDHRYLRYFIAVAEELNVTRAAERLNTVQPSLSQQIRRLEEIVGVELFLRKKHRLQLTDAGRVFLEESRMLLRETDRAMRRVREAARGEEGLMTIGFVPGIEGKLFTRVLPLFRTQYPQVDLTLRSMTSPQQLEGLHSQEINLGFLRPPIENQELVSEEILYNRILAVVPAAHPLAKKRRIAVEDLAALPFLEVKRSVAPAMHDIAHEVGRQAGVRFNSILPADNVITSLNEISLGMGFSLLPDYVADFLPVNVAARPLTLAHQPELPLLAAYKKNSCRPVVGRFLALLREQLAKK